MAETITERDRVVLLSDLTEGKVVRITLGRGESTTQIECVIDKPGQWPEGLGRAVLPDGTVTRTERMRLDGSGSWTTREQNPCQTEARQFTSYYTHLQVGSLLVVAKPGGGHMICGGRGDEITDIEVE